MDQRIQAYIPMREVEEKYRRLYLANQELYFPEKSHMIYRNWNEFKMAYRLTCPKAEELPDNPPTTLGETLMENMFFSDDNRDIAVVMNARYCPPFWHDLGFIKIMYVLNGSFRFNYAREKGTDIQAGNILIVPPGLEQSVFSFHDEDCVVNIFLRISTFEKNFSTLLSEGEVFAGFFWNVLYGKDENSIILIRCEKDEKLQDFVLDIMHADKEKDQYGNFYLTSFVSAFLSHILCEHKEEILSIHATELSSNKMPEIIRYIRENYNTVTLASLADHYQKSEEYLCRYIKKETGYSLTQLLKKYRVRQAAAMLREAPFISIEEIMYRVGYTDISYFYRIFKERYHITPQQYREQEHILNL